MCNLYSYTKPAQAARDLAKGLGDWNNKAGNLEPLDAIFPDGVAPVVRKTPKGRELLKMRWGFASPPQAKSDSRQTFERRQATSGSLGSSRNIAASYRSLPFANTIGGAVRPSPHGSRWTKAAPCSSSPAYGDLGMAIVGQRKSQ
jgi:putative SOS response-associated peptidase YedK